jgi:hypothetical protein
MGGACSSDGRHEKCTQNLTHWGRGKRPWESNIKRNLGEDDGRVWSGFIRLRTGTTGEHSTKLSGSRKDGAFLDYLSDD